jgi:CDP-glucose 4,6-dehydratase
MANVGSGKEYWSQRRVFVTGATGMIGSWLVKELLKLGAHVVALVLDAEPQSELYRSRDIDKISVVNGPLEDFLTLNRAITVHEVDTIFHLGAQTIVGAAHRFPLATFEANIRGTYNLLETCRLHRDLVQCVVVASSDKAYGEQDQLPYTEDMPLLGRYPYEVSKSCCDLLSQSYCTAYGLPVAITRCGNVYGGGDLNWSRIVPGTIRSFLRGDPPIIRSDGTYIRDYIYVKDVVDGYLWVAEYLRDGKVRGEAFNLSPESKVKVLDIVREIQRVMKCQHIEPRICNTAQGEIRSQYLSSAKAKRVLGWSPQYSLFEGLKETVAWYRDYLEAKE